MKYLNHLATLACALLVLAGCKYDDSVLREALDKQEMRISALEKWRGSVEEQLKSLQGILVATDYVTGVEKVEKEDKPGYKISFLHAQPITLYYNDQNEVSGNGLIGVAEEGGKYYWTLDGKPLMVGDQKVYVTADAPASLKPNKDNPEIFDLTIGDYTVTLDQHAVGPHPIKSVTTKEGKLIVTLPDNSTKELPLWVSFDDLINSTYPHAKGEASFQIALPKGYIMRPLGVPAGWSVSVKGTGAETVLAVTYPAEGAASVAFIISDGRSSSVVREVTFEVSAEAVVWTTIKFDGSTPIVIPEGVENIKVIGTTANPPMLSNNICTPIKLSKSLKRVDLSEVKHDKAIPANAFFNIVKSEDLDGEVNWNTNIEEITLPKNFAAIWGSAFRNCKALRTVTILKETKPNNVFADAFKGCDALEHIYVPSEQLVEAYKAFPGLKGFEDKLAVLPAGTQK